MHDECRSINGLILYSPHVHDVKWSPYQGEDHPNLDIYSPFSGKRGSRYVALKSKQCNVFLSADAMIVAAVEIIK